MVLQAGPHHLMCTAGDTKIKVWDTRTLDSVMSIRKMKGPQPVGYFVSALQFDQNKVFLEPLRLIVVCLLIYMPRSSLEA